MLEKGFRVLNLDYSPIKGPQGNIEYLIYIEKAEEGESLLTRSIEDIVAESHNTLGD